MGEGNGREILDVLEHAERQDSWAVIHNAHLMEEKTLKELKYYLQRTAKHRSE